MDDTESAEKSLAHEQVMRKQNEETKENLKKEMDEKQVKIKELETNIKRLGDMQRNIKADIMKVTEDRVDIESQIKVLEINKKRQQEKMNHYNKRIDDEKKLYKKIEYENNNLINNIKEMETQIATTFKFVDEKKKENESLQGYKKNLEEE